MFQTLFTLWCKITFKHQEIRNWRADRGRHLYCPWCGWRSPGFVTVEEED